MDIIEAIKERRSVRSYNGEALTHDKIAVLQSAIDCVWSPFGGNVTIILKQFDLKSGYKPSTYGVIKGATDFFLIGFDNEESSALSAGFMFEQVVLKAWQIGLGTCWIAGTFKGSDFERDVKWNDGQRLQVISPVGVAAEKSLMERFARFAMGSKNRKPFSELFFTDSFKQPLSSDSRYGKSLEMVRLAPSSTNSQPWRVLVDGEKVHFYYKSKGKFSIIDCGIGICHFYESEKSKGNNLLFYKEDYPIDAPDNWTYLYSCCPDK